MSYGDYLLTQSEAFQTRATTFMSVQGSQDWYPVVALPDGKCFWRALSQGVVYSNRSFDDVYRLSLDPFQYQVKTQNGSYDNYLKNELPYYPDGLYDTLFRRARRIFRLNLYKSQTAQDDELMRIFDLHRALKESPLDKHFGPGKAYGIFRTGSIMFDKDDKKLKYEVQRVQPSDAIGRFWRMFKDEYSLEDDTLRAQLAHWRKVRRPRDDLAVYDANVDVKNGILQVMVAENTSNGRTDDDFSISWAGQSELAIASHLPCVRSIQCWNMNTSGWIQWDGGGNILSNPKYNVGADVCLLYNGTHYDTLIHSSRIGDYLSTVHQKKTTSKKKKTSKKKSTSKKPTYIQYGHPPPGTKEN